MKLLKRASLFLGLVLCVPYVGAVVEVKQEGRIERCKKFVRNALNDKRVKVAAGFAVVTPFVVMLAYRLGAKREEKVVADSTVITWDERKFFRVGTVKIDKEALDDSHMLNCVSSMCREKILVQENNAAENKYEYQVLDLDRVIGLVNDLRRIGSTEKADKIQALFVEPLEVEDVKHRASVALRDSGERPSVADKKGTGIGKFKVAKKV